MLLCEQLESRLVPSTLIPVSNHRDLVFDASRGLLYITTSAGAVQRYNVASQTLLSPLTVGTSLNGADITPDGSALYVTENQLASNPAQGVLHKVNLASGAVTDLKYDLSFYLEAGSFDIAIGSGGKGLFDGRFSGSGWTPTRQVDLATDALSVRPDANGSGGGGQVRQDTLIHRSADRSLFFFTESNISNGPVFTYNATTDTFAPGTATNTFLDNALSAVNRNGTLIALELNNGITIMDRACNTVQTLPNLTGGMAFDPVRDLLYAASTNGQVIAYDTNTWTVKFQLAVGETVTGSSAFGNGVMTVSNDGSLLFLATTSGVRMIGSGIEMSSTAIVTFMPGCSIACSGSESSG